jgi:DNA-binding winged helix-turn-helix (wHTH) protein
VIRYRFSEFILSPQRRLLLREGREVPLIPRYFDLLLLLVERRREAVHRREIFDRVWGDVMVSDSALSQAVRTIRRTLEDDDPREPRFIRTVSRHGYQFVFPEVVEEQEDEPAAFRPPDPPIAVHSQPAEQPSDDHADGRQRLVRVAGRMASAAAAGGAAAGVAAGVAGGLMLAFAPGSSAPVALAPVLAVIGGGCGGLGGAGVGAGLGVAATLGSSHRILSSTLAAAVGGGFVGAAVQWLSRWALAALVGLELPIGGTVEGLLIGAATGLAVAAAEHLAADTSGRGSARGQMAVFAALACGTAGLLLTLSGRPLAGGTIHAIADSADGSRATLAPLGRLIGEPDFGPVSSAILSFGEGAVFGIGVAFGLSRRPGRRR